MSELRRAVMLDGADSAAVVLESVREGERCALPGDLSITARGPIPRGHKIAVRRIARGASVIKYAHPIGVATAEIEVGSWVHSHNLRSALEETVSYEPPRGRYSWREPDALTAVPATFRGFRRSDGSVGIRNEIWILPTVGCINKTAEAIAAEARGRLGIDVFAFSHPHGCSQLGEDLARTRKILAGLARHPNAAGVLVLSLGCEDNTLDALRAEMGPVDPARVKFLALQEVSDERSAALRRLDALADYVARFAREELPISELTIGLKCGGSDGFSGITANPTVGCVSDLVVASGGSALLTEVPEMFGAEAVLMERASSALVFEKTVSLINDFKSYFLRHGHEVHENPSPGDRDGGITTLEEKSLGCIGKSGSSPVADVIPYGAPRATRGLTLVAGPENDLVSTTALSAAGAHLILFTTGRGTPFGAPAPTLKIATSSALAERKPAWIDFDAGRVLAGASIDELGAELFRLVVDVASGKRTKSELSGNRDIAILKDGVTL
ncbi:altronate dehydratase family protein [Sorangium sp. So ce136]|uniref:UxaA family hydrolase n=1 Tax=Sorangium sp. So ce136 TaxID=3133284 RepID=UPI003F0B57F8